MYSTAARLKAAGLHLLLSIFLVGLVAAVALSLWYPRPYRELSGGFRLLLILACVDVMIGPLNTAAIFDLRKGWPALRKDLAVIGILQFAALGYGAWSMFQARPVYLIFEYDRFRVLHAVDVDPQALSRAPDGYQRLPWNGPTTIALRKLTLEDRSKFAVEDATGETELSQRPEVWQPYDADARARVLAAAKPMDELAKRLPQSVAILDDAMMGLDRAQVVYLPLVDGGEVWTVLLDGETADPLTYLPLDPF